MPKSFTDEFGIHQEIFENTKALDIILDVDSNYFIDPALLRVCEIPEFIDASKITEEHFSNIIVLLKHSRALDVMYWKKQTNCLHLKKLQERVWVTQTKGLVEMLSEKNYVKIF